MPGLWPLAVYGNMFDSMQNKPVDELPIKHYFGGGIYIKETFFKAGEMGEKHTHNFEHLSYLVSGKVKLVVDGVSIDMEGPQHLIVKADKVHQVYALTDTVWLCCHSTQCTDPEKIDMVLIESGYDPKN